ncbi:AIM24 family protein [Butyrivibrio sp. DSM 10294]|uniref:AIM24 family protein n=1 Tax=Butyrivibrio sp. DSM 10294 TaxID=2972457 RepID=UPI00234F2F58|nr:AIM24 family protein [Butyrivibrio sp. DSM 10294]MDC7293532.1 AIM24 family protein [Butyrivibrio sp. DSM 10294]
MITTNLFNSSDAKKITLNKGIFTVVEYERDLSVDPEMAEMAYFAAMMDVRKRQLIAKIEPGLGAITQKGIMQLMLGDLQARTDISGLGNLMKKYIGSKVTGESAIKPLYTGEGTLVLEPTFKYIILEDLDEWEGKLTIEDGMFLACEDSVQMKVVARTTVSSAVLGGEGLFNTSIYGTGVVALESPVPRSELIEVNLDNDVLKIDGNMAIAWSTDLKFTVERTTPTLVGSMAAGEGLVNVYRGTGRVLIAPVQNNRGIANPKDKK